MVLYCANRIQDKIRLRIIHIIQGGAQMAQITKDTMIGELLTLEKDVTPILLGIGMHCLGCPSSQMETIADAAMVHGLEPDALVNEINAFLAG